MERYKLVFTGSGGQGVITAAIILAETAALYENLNATQTQVYGPEARGGATRADVIISDVLIHYPKVTRPDILVCLTQEAYDKFSPVISPGGLLLTDSRFVKPRTKVDARQVQFPMYSTIMEKIGKAIVFNICMLGVVIGLTSLLKPESVMKSLKTRIPPSFLDINKQALDIGIELGIKEKR